MPTRISPKEIISEHPDLAEIAQQHGRMVEVAILNRDKIRAYECVDRAFLLLEDFSQPQILECTPVDVLFDPKTATILEKNGINTIGFLTKHSEELLCTMWQIKKSTVNKIKKLLALHGYCLATDFDVSEN